MHWLVCPGAAGLQVAVSPPGSTASRPRHLCPSLSFASVTLSPSQMWPLRGAPWSKGLPRVSDWPGPERILRGELGRIFVKWDVNAFPCFFLKVTIKLNAWQCFLNGWMSRWGSPVCPLRHPGMNSNAKVSTVCLLRMKDLSPDRWNG